MNQLVFKFPFKTKYFEQDYYVSTIIFQLYKLIENWPNWPDKFLNIFGPKSLWQNSLIKYFERKSKLNLYKMHKIKINNIKI